MFTCCSQPRATASAAGVARHHRASGFSFVEILFAVAVMGVGFIMLAAIFPVGLQQTKLTLDETTAAANARGAIATLSQLAQTLTQYNFTLSDPKQNSTYLMPHTCVQTLPVAGTGPNQLALGRSRTLPGQVRSFRDGRNFTDAGAMTIPPAVPNNTTLRRDVIWNKISSELLSKSNDRNAYVALYRRDLIATNVNGLIVSRPSESAQVIVINAQVAAQSAYSANDSGGAAGPIYNLEPRPVGVRIERDANGSGAFIANFFSVKGTVASPPASDTTNFSNSPAYDQAVNAVAEGTFIIISDDRITTAGSEGRMNGRIYRVGNFRSDTNPVGWALAPGYDFNVDPGKDGVPHNGTAAANTPGSYKDDITALGYTGNLPIDTSGDGSDIASDGPAVAYVLGRGFSDPTLTPGVGGGFYSGLAQDVAVYTTFVSAK